MRHNQPPMRTYFVNGDHIVAGPNFPITSSSNSKSTVIRRPWPARAKHRKVRWFEWWHTHYFNLPSSWFPLLEKKPPLHHEKERDSKNGAYPWAKERVKWIECPPESYEKVCEARDCIRQSHYSTLVNALHVRRRSPWTCHAYRVHSQSQPHSFSLSFL